MEWISVKDGYPKYAEGVLVTDGIAVGYALWDRELLKWVKVHAPWEDFNCAITHWMLLPEPPQKQS